MTGEEIKAIVEENNRTIETLMKPNQFVLNNMIRDLLEANAKLQRQCPHKFLNGYCEYCLMEEPHEG